MCLCTSTRAVRALHRDRTMCLVVHDMRGGHPVKAVPLSAATLRERWPPFGPCVCPELLLGFHFYNQYSPGTHNDWLHQGWWRKGKYAVEMPPSATLPVSRFFCKPQGQGDMSGRKDVQEASRAILQMFTVSWWAVLSLPLADKHGHQHKQIDLKVTTWKQYSTGEWRASPLATGCLD